MMPEGKKNGSWGGFAERLLFAFPLRRFDRIAHTRETMSSDGLNSLSYEVLRTDRFPLYTRITVDIGAPGS